MPATGFESEFYTLVVDTGEYDGPCKGHQIYRLINKENGVAEGESISLLEGIQVLMQRTVALRETIEYYSGPFQMPDSPPIEIH